MVGFDFAKMKQESKVSPNTALKALILGASGSGKSYTAGTLKVPTLFLYLTSESHGPISASATNPDIFAVCLDRKEVFDSSPGKPGDILSPDESLKKLRAILANDITKDFKALVIDSITDLEILILKSDEFKSLCTTDKGKINDFKKPEAVLMMLSDLFGLIDKHWQNGMHVVATCASHVTNVDSSGTAENIVPVLTSYGVVEKVVRIFPDILLLTTIERANEEGVEEKKRCFSFNTNVNKVSKDLSGKIKKTLNFSARITGLSDEETPDVMAPNLQKVLALKHKSK
jgi:hypothetical protein